MHSVAFAPACEMKSLRASRVRAVGDVTQTQLEGLRSQARHLFDVDPAACRTGLDGSVLGTLSPCSLELVPLDGALANSFRTSLM